MARVTVIGQGYVGLPLAIEAAMAGHEVIGFDIDECKILDLQRGITNIPDVESKVIRKLISDKSYLATTNPNSMADSDIIIFAVPTPLDDSGNPDTSFLIAAAEICAKYCNSTALIINESTSYPGTLRNLIEPIFKMNPRLDNIFAAAPERVDPGNPQWNLKNTTRVVAGLTLSATEKAFNFYSTFCSNVKKVSSPEVAEAAKLFENTFRMVNIALVNEFALICKNLNISSHEVLEAAATKPFGFMKFSPSIGVGGHCIPVDPIYLTYSAKKVGAESALINLAHNLNVAMPKRVSKIIEAELDDNLANKKIQLVGIAYKPDVSDLRESPALELIEELRKMGATVTWCDPLVGEYKGELSSNLETDIDLGVILAPHGNIDFSIWSKSSVKVLDMSVNSNNYGWDKAF
jgi:UDP-N-acetyl-D-glucosamine dehydrogenase